MFKLGARPSGVFKTDQKMDDKVWKRLKTHIAEQYFGKTNTGRPMLLSHGMDWTQISLSNTDMQYLEQRQWSKDVVREVFGVPPILMGQYKEASVLSNAETQIKTFWTVTINSWTEKLNQIFTEQLLPRISSQTDIRFRFDMSDVKELQADKEKLSTILKTGFGMGGVTPNDFITKVLGDDPSTEAGMDSYYVPLNVVPIADAGADASDVGGDDPDKALERMKEGLDKWEGLDGWLERSQKAIGQQDKDMKLRIAKANAHGVIMQIAIKEGKKFEKTLNKLFERQEKEVLANVNSNKLLTLEGFCKDVGLSFKKLDEPVYDDELKVDLKYSVEGASFNFAYWVKEFKKSGQPHIAEAVRLAGISMSKELGEVYVIDAISKAFIAQRATEYATVVNETTQLRVNALVAQGLSDGWTVATLADKIQKYYTNNAAMRAVRIARTEMVGAANASRSHVMVKSKKVNKKMWSTQRDGAVRDSHSALEGKTIKADGKESWGDHGYADGYSLDFPSSVNERCFEIPIRAKKEF